jgi:type II secretory pathway component PulC
MAQRNLQVNKSELKELAKQALSTTTQQPKAAPSPRRRRLSWILPTSIIIAIILAIGLYSLLSWQKSDVSVLSSLNNKLTGKEPIFGKNLSTDAKMATLLLTDIKSNRAEPTAFIIMENQSSKPYTVGQEVLPNAVINKIYSDQVIIQYKDAIVTLFLQDRGTRDLAESNDKNNEVLSESRVNPSEQISPSEYFQHNVAVIPDPAGSGGFVVQSVEPMSPYASFGVRPGDIVYNLDGKPHYDAWENSQVFEVYRDGQRVLLKL